ncbi:hypothetical protein PG994_003864 [Apiospora phragmitis]|uniref:Uncharacterized protein n=1 Tax=Apiospora phragmitis TaxID=2905665 RepID=A0ABR1VZB4_9PEZI
MVSWGSWARRRGIPTSAPALGAVDRYHDLGSMFDRDAISRGDATTAHVPTIAAIIAAAGFLHLRVVHQQVTARIVKQLRRAPANGRQGVPDQELGK